MSFRLLFIISLFISTIYFIPNRQLLQFTQTATQLDSIPLHSHNHQTGMHCAFDEIQSYLGHNHPKLVHQQYKLEQLYLDLSKKGQLNGQAKALVTLPVVVHVVHNGGVSNIPLSQVQTAIQQLNNAFANTAYYNPNTGVGLDRSLRIQQYRYLTSLAPRCGGVTTEGRKTGSEGSRLSRMANPVA